MNTRYSTLFESFKRYFPTLASQAVDGYVSGPQEITVYLSDDDKLIYDDCTQTIRYLNKTIDNPEEDVLTVSFEYDEAFVNYLAQSVANQYKRPLDLLGLWHRHPGSMDVFSS